MLKQTRKPDCHSDYKLDLLINSELSSGERLKVEQHLRVCALCEGRHAALAGHALAFENSAPPLPATEAQESWLTSLGRRWQWIPALAVGAAVLLWFGLPPESGTPIDENATMTKGGLSLQLVVRHGKWDRKAVPGEAVMPGDSLQFIVGTDKAGYVLILSRDGQGTWSSYYPANGRSVAIAVGGDQLLAGSVVMDNALGAETLYGLVCDHRIDFAEAKFKLENAAPEMLEGCTVTTTHFNKVPKL